MNNKFEIFAAILSGLMMSLCISLMKWAGALQYASGVFAAIIFFLMAFMCFAMLLGMVGVILSDVNWKKAHYMAQHYVSKIVAPVLKLTGYRFGKAWRGNFIVNHVEANMMADGFVVQPMKMV